MKSKISIDQLKIKYDKYFGQFDHEVNLSDIPSVKSFFKYLELDLNEFEKIKHNENIINLIYKGVIEIKRSLYKLLNDTLERENKEDIDFKIINNVKRKLVETFFYNPEYLSNL